MLGGRLVFSSPSQFVRLGASAYRATSQGEGDEADEEVDDLVYSIHVELETDRTWVRAEAYHFHEEDEAEADGAYIEVAHFVDEHWQLAARWDWVDTEIEEVEIPEELESLTEHRDLALGLNYWISRGFVIKTAAHWVEGNRFALSGDFFEELEGDEPDGLEDETLLFEVGLQFSF